MLGAIEEVPSKFASKSAPMRLISSQKKLGWDVHARITGKVSRWLEWLEGFAHLIRCLMLLYLDVYESTVNASESGRNAQVSASVGNAKIRRLWSNLVL